MFSSLKCKLFAKGAVEVVSLAKSKSGFYSHYFLIPKQNVGLRPVLHFRYLNRSLMK